MWATIDKNPSIYNLNYCVNDITHIEQPEMFEILTKIWHYSLNIESYIKQVPVTIKNNLRTI